MNGIATMETVNNVLVAVTEELLLSIQARGVREGSKVLLLGHANITNDATVATHRNTLRIRQGSLVADAQVGEDAVFDSVTGAGLLIENNIAMIDNADEDDPVYGLFALDTHADTVTFSSLIVIPIG